MGLFKFIKQGVATVATPKVDKPVDKPVEKTPITYQSSLESIPLKGDVASVDCKFDPKDKSYTYLTDTVVDLKEDERLEFVSKGEDTESNYTAFYEYEFGNLIVTFIHNSSKFGKQPYEVGKVIGTFSVVKR